jgi:pyruvate formate lyase activating enzyme
MVKEISPEQVLENAINNDCKIIAYTYNEPTVFYEYMIECAKLAKKKGIKNVIVSNGFINQEPLKELCKYIDGANIDLKSFDNAFYKKITNSWIQPVLESLKILKKNNVWLEITMLIIPKLNDDPEKIKEMCNWIKKNLGKDVPLHFTAFYPCYKLMDYPRTKAEILIKARKIALGIGLKYVYIGNLPSENGNNTYCPKCKKLLIERSGFGITKNNIKNSKCDCGEKIQGVFQ